MRAKVLIHGGGRMGCRLLAAVMDSDEFELAGLVSELRPEGLAAADWRTSLADFNSAADLLIDFTLTGGPGVAAHWCEENRVPLLSGTTALSDEDKSALQSAANKVPVMWAPNLSLGIALMNGLVRKAAGTLGMDAAIHVTETHHVHKLDAPSGTALALAESARKARPLAGDDEITFTSNREGEVVGEHTVCFSFGDEVLELTHKALDRDIFVHGALKAGSWLIDQAPGRYTTEDWLGQA
jgi:4-hydroxy-tetrahydrodipicolinate reductase